MLRRRRHSHEPRSDAPLVSAGERIYAIGDIHGRHDLLLALLSRILEDAECRRDGRRVRMVFLGDYIDRGDQSREVLTALASIARDARPDAVFLKGNHEAALLDFLEAPRRGAAWLSYGGLQTLANFGIRALRAESTAKEFEAARDDLEHRIRPLLPFLRSLALQYRSGDVVFTHAGVDPSNALEQQSEEALLWGHSAAESEVPFDGLRIVHGHFDRLNPVVTPGRICVDTGAYYTGILTAVRLDAGQEFLSVGG